ncbi:DUF4261 domain-containing protein [Dactylosporangium siamense]|uniref:DUF4261 domain-containing protein n=1 Tax=Dactylosporangium siamense TaxID=685454 RepID=A0A919PUB5_9ACTN|nr:DUF4261 domain-containing protein [Dactylosporangium siamense]GIG49862.1 hypothetical protein Dsi01nite_079030 [Dactylosporangium siamense]
MNSGLAAELCYVDAVRPRPADVLSGIRRFWPSAELVDGTGRGGGLMVAFPELTTLTGDGVDIRLLVSVGRPLPRPGDARGRRDLTQTWEWPDAAATMAAVRHTVTVTEVFGTSFAPANRVRAFTAAVRGLAEVPAPAAIWWPASGVATPPAALAVRPLAGLVNVRLFNVAGSPGRLLMDTLGLGPLGLPDLECVFSGLPEEHLAAYLTALAEDLVGGRTIRSGSVVQGLLRDGRWRVTAATASVDPERPVLSITPGAGGRR